MMYYYTHSCSGAANKYLFKTEKDGRVQNRFDNKNSEKR